ncbi:MAG: histone H1, partial [Gammaproteobacteria bacterium]
AKPKRPTDVNQRANLIARIATGEIQDIDPDKDKNPQAIAKGRLGGLIGGKARADSLTPAKRKAIAKKAAAKRWDKK